MIKIILLGIILLFIAILLLGVRVFFTKKGEFPNIHISGNKEMQKKGIGCVTSQDAEMNAKESKVEKLLKSENL